MSDKPYARPARGLPEAVGPYRIVSLLGRGGMGVVYKGRDEAKGREVAVKVLLTDVEGDAEVRERFLREAAVTKTLRHRNIITILDVGEEAGRIFITTELLDGVTLGEFIKSTVPGSVTQKIDLLLQACDGLSTAHAKGIVHRDITPGNLFVQSDGGLKILDFGIARLADSKLTKSGFIMGTPGYLSPEQARGRRVDSRADIFSLAAVFYHVFTGRRPFDAAGLPAVLKKVIMDDPPPIQEYEAPAGLARILMRALQKDPDLRYQRMAEMAADLIRFKREGNRAVLSAPPAVEERQPEIAPDRNTPEGAADPRAAVTSMGMKTTAFPLAADARETDGGSTASTAADTAGTGGLRDAEGGAISADPAPSIR